MIFDNYKWIIISVITLLVMLFGAICLLYKLTRVSYHERVYIDSLSLHLDLTSSTPLGRHSSARILFSKDGKHWNDTLETEFNSTFWIFYKEPDSIILWRDYFNDVTKCSENDFKIRATYDSCRTTQDSLRYLRDSVYRRAPYFSIKFEKEFDTITVSQDYRELQRITPK